MVVWLRLGIRIESIKNSNLFVNKNLGDRDKKNAAARSNDDVFDLLAWIIDFDPSNRSSK
ncbi:MAG: hypothetical protein B6244_11015 [Candidatus Cloacimonetes bacterium 4572_55]|nr:MAG: hypothetical protein B6244_11015 [Candidatus Cloacimonetes bacterium 4572_55]